ncbi:glycosyltransferase family 2 protein (plasmid) [Kovacikia minuta CCNUW1]|uniref:glycosyltransferase n=1 Tax=Kovacikia minuta TaxID=2931930 RepID=UPI001CCDA0DC|nr:glycosyltransferase family 2 protein [Kovacikia minuta]UBF30409.1 glycosyltransferase family 2 protein [Kovacikia minuta CCNUW1]
MKQLPQIASSQAAEVRTASKSPLPKISVIIPAFNEEENIEDCVKSVITSTQRSAAQLEVWIIDDQSTDRTPEILQTLQMQLADPRLNLIAGLPRPSDQVWTGKNWACHQGASLAKGEFLLFIDADMRLKPDAISAVVQVAIAHQLDFLTCIPTIVCGSLIEWLVQPLMFINLIVSFNSQAVKNPKAKTSFALGPFLLFRASTYNEIGGHQSVAGQIAEDVAFARKLKHGGFKLQQFIGTDLASLRMYRNWQSLWEGWTKVLYVGAQQNFGLMVLLMIVMILVYTIPWVGLAIATVQVLQNSTAILWAEIGLAGLAIVLQFWIRKLGSQALGTSTKYWWLQSIGGFLIALLAITSVIKAETGWGWTWRGRKLVSVK